jgi:hypothetical protein
VRHLSPSWTRPVLWCIFLLLCGLGLPALATQRNVQTYGAAGNGASDDAPAINSAIAALVAGDELYFPCPSAYYRINSNLSSITLNNITIDGQTGCGNGRVKISLSQAGGAILTIGTNSLGGTAVALSATANEGSTSFTTALSLGVSVGQYVHIFEGGAGSATSSQYKCDVAGCRGEVLEVTGVSGNTITVATMLHDTYTPTPGGVINSGTPLSCTVSSGSGNCASAQMVNRPTSGTYIHDLLLEGNSATNTGLQVLGAVNGTVTNVTSQHFTVWPLYLHYTYGMSLNGITTQATLLTGNEAMLGVYVHGNLLINGFNASHAWSGVFFSEGANDTITNLTADGTGTTGRLFKTTTVRYATWNGLTIQNNSGSGNNGITLEYYTSHNTFNNCVVTNNGGSGVGNGNSGIAMFGNWNQYNSFNNCTVSGNGNTQLSSGVEPSGDGISNDSNITINGGTWTGSNSSEPVIYIHGPANATVNGAVIRGPGPHGIYVADGSTNACINDNAFITGTGLSAAITSGSSGNVGSGNILNGLSSNLALGTCASGAPAPPTGLTATVN